MRFLSEERETLERLLPGLDDRLAELPLADRERADGRVIGLFRDARATGLLVPEIHGGIGASALDAVRVQRAIGSRSPSLAVASTMHHFSVASLVAVADGSQGFEWILLEGIAKHGRLVASGFAEGNPGQSILAPTMQATPTANGFVISGTKKPCSLAHSMDLLTASVVVPARDRDGEELAVALVPAADERVERRPFWNNPALAGAESDEVVVGGVEVPEDLIVRTGAGPNERLDGLQLQGFLWFELLMTASYLGAASGLAERLLAAGKGTAEARAEVCLELEAAMAGVERLATLLDAGEHHETLFARALFVRYAAQGAVARSARAAFELLGGIGFASSPDVSYLVVACQALQFHPPARSRMGEQLVEALAGNPLTVA